MVLTVPSDTPNSSDMWVREISARLKVSDTAGAPPRGRAGR